MNKKNRNRIIIVIVLLALIGYYIYTQAKKVPPLVVTGSGVNGSNGTNGVTGVTEVVTIDNPVNTGTEELIGVTTNPTEVTDLTADQTTTCFTGCPDVQSVIVTNGSCEENNLLPFPPPCAPPNNNNGNFNNTFTNTNIPTNTEVAVNTSDGVFTGGLGTGTSGVNVTSGLNSVSGLNCGGSSFADSVIGFNSIAEPQADTISNSVGTGDLSIVDTGFSSVNAVPEISTGTPYSDGSNFVSNTGLSNNANPNQSLVSATELNQEALGVYDFNSGLANAYNENVVTAVGTSATATTTGLPTRNNRL